MQDDAIGRPLRVYNGGTYDLLHSGHLYTLRACRALAGPGGEVIIGLNLDDFVARFKGHPTVQDYLERAEVLTACRYVDRVVPNIGGEDSRAVLEAVMPDVILAGADWFSDDHDRYCRQMGFTTGWLADRGIGLRYVPRLVPGRSSTNTRETAGEVASEYGRLLAERDRLVADGVDPADLEVPRPPPPGHPEWTSP